MTYTAPAISPKPREGSAILGRYIIDGFVGYGPLAEVYRARVVRSEQRVAVKFLSPLATPNPKGLVSYLLGVTALGRDSVPGVAKVLDSGTEGHRHFVVEEWLDGPFLSEETLRATGPWPARRVASLICSLAEVLAGLHAVGVVHGDVRLENLYVDRLHGALRLHNVGLTRLARPGVRPSQAKDIAGLGATGLCLLAGGRLSAADRQRGLVDEPELRGILEWATDSGGDIRPPRATTLRNRLRSWLGEAGERTVEPASREPDDPLTGQSPTSELAVLRRVAGLPELPWAPDSERRADAPRNDGAQVSPALGSATRDELIDKLYARIGELRARATAGEGPDALRPELDAAVARLRQLQHEEAADYEAAVATEFGFDPKAALEVLREARRVVDAHRPPSK